jgi:hypothetical protein
MAGLFHQFRDCHDLQFLHAIRYVADEDIIPGVMEAARLTMMTARDRKGVGGDLRWDALPLDNLCCILKYVEEDTIPSFYSELNRRSFAKDRSQIRPFVPFMWLFMKTLELLRPWDGKMVNRGVKLNLKDQYPLGREFIWHGFTSTTKDVGVLSNPMFLGGHGDRTLFQIELTQNQARDISIYSPLEEGEILLPPGSRFRVNGVLPSGDGLTIIQLIELPSPAWIINLCPHGAFYEAKAKKAAEENAAAQAAAKKAAEKAAAEAAAKKAAEKAAAEAAAKKAAEEKAAQGHPLKGLWRPARKNEWWIGKIPYGSHKERAAHPDTWMRIEKDGSGRWNTMSKSKAFGPLTWKMYYHWYGDIEVDLGPGPSWNGTHTSKQMKVSVRGTNEYTLDSDGILKRYSATYDETSYWYRASN